MLLKKIKMTVGLCLFATTLLMAQKDTISDVNNLVKLSLEDLMNIKVVTASGISQTASEAPSTITVITEQQIKERGYEQLEDALRDIPGIDMIHINGYAPTLIYFRGMYGAENLRALLMIDGIAENNILGTNDMAGPAYNLHNVARIEIVWGPVSALYGASAFGGVINIITKKGGDINGFNIEQGFGSFNTIFQNLSMGARRGNWEISLAGSLYSSDGPTFTNRDPNYRGSYVDKAYSFNGAVSYYTNTTKTTIGYRVYKTPMGWGTYSNSPTEYFGLPPQGNGNLGIIGVVSRPFRGEESGLDDSYLRTFFVQNDWSPNKKWSLMGRFTYRETGIGEDSYIYITVNGTKMIRAKIATYSNRARGELSGNYTISTNQHLTGGIEFFQDNVEKGPRKSTIDLNTYYLVDGKDTVVNINSTFLPRVFDIRNNFGSYLQYVINTKILNKTSFTLGARYDYNSYFGNAISPRIAIVNNYTDKLTFKLQYGMAFRPPTNLEIYQVPPTGNYKLKMERLRSYEANAIYSPSKSVQIQFNGFRNDMSDVIVLGNLSGLNPDKNPGVLHLTGLVGILNVYVNKNISGYLNFTWQDPQGKNLITGASGQVPGVARIKGNAGMTFHVQDFLILTLSTNYVGSRHSPRTDPYGMVKGYILANFNLSTGDLFKIRLRASFSVHNVFNTTWLDPGFRTADGLIYSTVLEQPGIMGLFKVGLSF